MSDLVIKQPLTFTAILHVIQLAVIFAGGVWFFSDINGKAGERFAIINARLDQIDKTLAKIDVNLYTQTEAAKDFALVEKNTVENEERLDRQGDRIRLIEQGLAEVKGIVGTGPR